MGLRLFIPLIIYSCYIPILVPSLLSPKPHHHKPLLLLLPHLIFREEEATMGHHNLAGITTFSPTEAQQCSTAKGRGSNGSNYFVLCTESQFVKWKCSRGEIYWCWKNYLNVFNVTENNTKQEKWPVSYHVCLSS